MAGSSAAALCRPSLVAAQSQRVLKFVPQADLALLNPVQTTGLVARNHGILVFDTLYGVDMNLRPYPQMVEGRVVEEEGRLGLITLRPGLKFHDGKAVLARDCVASIRRWASRDAYAQSMMAAVDELSAPSDREIRFRLKQPFPLLRDVLGKPGSNICVIMPERLASRDGLQPGHRDGGKRPIPLSGRRAHPGIQGRVLALRRFRPAHRRNAQLPVRTQGRPFRPGGVDHHA